MKTIRLLYPDWLSGGLTTYYFGANLLQHILPANPDQPTIKVDIAAPDGSERLIEDGILGKSEVLAGIEAAQKAIADSQPDHIITIGGNCLVSHAPFDYLHGLYPDAKILWIDAHPDVSVPQNGYPNAHAMVLGALMGAGESSLRAALKNPAFNPDDLLYIGLQSLHNYQAKFLDDLGVNYKVQTENFVSDKDIQAFVKGSDHLLVHLDIDVLDPRCFHSTYFANPELVGDGSGGGRMTLQQLESILKLVSDNTDIVGFTIAEYLPFDEERLSRMSGKLKLFSQRSA